MPTEATRLPHAVATMNGLPDEDGLLDSRLLIVDDEASNVILLERILQRAKFTNFVSTTSPLRALELFRETEPDILLTDLAMPQMDGFALMEAIRSARNGAMFSPIIVLTADATLPTKQRALAAGATDFLTKPFDNLEVVLRIKNHLRTRMLYRVVEEHNMTLERTVAERTRDLRDALEKLELAQQRLVQNERLSALGTMASGIAHDFNNLLSVILGFGSLLLREVREEDQESRRFLETIVTAAEDGTKIVNRLREFQRPPSREEVHAPLDLNKLIEQTIALTKPRWDSGASTRGRRIHVVQELGELPLVPGLGAELRELLTNLIFNAVDAMPQGGTITIRTAREADGVELQVADTGTGMTEETRQRCLEPFFTTKGEHGTGLGLAMVYGVVQRHNGTLQLDSAPGKGTTFTIHLPAQDTDLAQATAEADTVSERLLHILIVDDEPVLCHLLSDYLSNDFHSVEVATDPIEALDKFRAGKFDVVITDRSMPRMSGDELAKAVKELNPKQPVIMLTGDASEDEEEMICEGVDLVTPKPFSLSQVRNALARVTALTR